MTPQSAAASVQAARRAGWYARTWHQLFPAETKPDSVAETMFAAMEPGRIYARKELAHKNGTRVDALRRLVVQGRVKKLAVGFYQRPE